MAPERKRREIDREKRKIEEEWKINRGRVILEKKNDSQATGRTHESFSRERERERVEGKKKEQILSRERTLGGLPSGNTEEKTRPKTILLLLVFMCQIVCLNAKPCLILASFT
jgi:hypothetical protein